MSRVALSLDQDGDLYRTAISRIRKAKVVDLDATPEVIIADNIDGLPDNVPTLLVNHELPDTSDPIYPGFIHRFTPESRSIRESLDSGKLGRLGLVRMHLWRPHTRPFSVFDKIGAIDLVLWLFEKAPHVVHSVTRHPQSKILHLGFDGGGMAIVDFVEGLKEGDGYQSLCAIGADGAAYADDHRNRNLVFDGGLPKAFDQARTHLCLQPLIESFLDDIHHSRGNSKAMKAYRNANAILEEMEAMA